MSKWTDVRDNIVDALHVDDVTEDVKQKVTSTILAQVLPVISEAVDGFTGVQVDDRYPFRQTLL